MPCMVAFCLSVLLKRDDDDDDDAYKVHTVTMNS